jgi:hypothetical protein
MNVPVLKQGELMIFDPSAFSRIVFPSSTILTLNIASGTEAIYPERLTEKLGQSSFKRKHFCIRIAGKHHNPINQYEPYSFNPLFY